MSGLATLRQNLAELQGVIRRPQTKKTPQTPPQEQATQPLSQVEALLRLPRETLEGLAGLGRLEQQLGQILELQRHPPAQPVAQVALPEKFEQLLTNVALLLQKGVAPREGDAPSEGWIRAQISSASVPVGISRDLEAQVTDFWGRPIAFAHITLTQVAISAPQLVDADAVRLRVYRRGTRAEPQDLLAEFDGTSQVTGMWAASFTSRQIEFSGLDERSKLYLTVRNTSGNSGPTTFQIYIYGYHYPAVAPPAA